MSGWVAERYSHRLLLGSFWASVSWATSGEKGYAASFSGVTLSRRYGSVDEAKAAAENLARRRLASAMRALDELAKEPTDDEI